MGFHIEDYEKLRPYVYHTCPSGNARRILDLRRMEPTAALLELGGRSDLLRTKRDQDLELVIEGASVLIRDQMPLNRPISNSRLAGVWLTWWSTLIDESSSGPED